MGTMEWIYCNLKNGRLVDDNGAELNSLWPSFATWQEAEQYLVDEDIRATLR